MSVNPNTVRILLGEDDGIVALDMQEQLPGLGYQVEIHAGTRREVLTLAREFKPDIVVLDFNIEGDLHGIEVARKLREVAMLPVVFMTAYSSDVVENAPAIREPFRYVTKPFVLTELHAAIQQLVGGEKQDVWRSSATEV